MTNGELPRLPLYVSRRLTAVTRTTMRNKRRQRHLHVCDARGLSKPPWWQDERERADVLALSLPVRDRLRLFAGLGRAVSYGTGLDGASKAAYAFDCSVGLTLRCCIAQYETFSRTGYAPFTRGSRRGVTLAAAANGRRLDPV